MAIEKEFGKLLNLLEMNAHWVVLEKYNAKTDSFESELKKIEDMIPENTGNYLVSGIVKTKNGKLFTVVVEISSDDSGEIFAAFWKVGKKWYQQMDDDFKNKFKNELSELFPVKYELNVKVEGDTHN